MSQFSTPSGERFAPEGLHRAPKVLVVDSDVPVRRLLQFSLRRSGCEVLLAENGDGALQQLEPGGVADVVLLDFNLPGHSSLDTLRRIVSLPKPPSVIVMSAHGSAQDAVECLREGAYDYVRKTNGLDDLRVAMRNALEALGLREEVEQLRAQLAEPDAQFPEIVSSSPAMQQVKKLVRTVSSRDITVLIEGESGSGKELVAHAIHSHGTYRDQPFVAINCAAIPENLLESELFGHERGAFTGAIAKRKGKFEEANGGTLFLDEVGELNPNLQAKMLRVLQTQEIQPVGGQMHKVNVRIVSATNQDLSRSVRQGLFRQDLYYRLAVFPIQIPPLHARREDILPLAHHFLERFAVREGREILGFSSDVERALIGYDWPGNVRELENMIFRAVVLCESSRLELSEFPVLSLSTADSPEGSWDDPPPDMAWSSGQVGVGGGRAGGSPGGMGQASAAAGEDPLHSGLPGVVVPIEQLEAAAIRRALRVTSGNVSRAAGELGISRATLYRKAKKFSISIR